MLRRLYDICEYTYSKMDIMINIKDILENNETIF